MAVDNQKFEEALKNRNFEEAMTMLTDGSIHQERESAKLRKNRYQEIRENRQLRVNDLAMSYEGFGWNANTALLALQAGSGMFGLVPKGTEFFGRKLNYKALSQAGIQCFSAIKNLRDPGLQGTQTSLNHALEDMKRIQDDLKGDDQRSSSAVSDLMNQIKQLHQMMHEASSQMSRSH